MLVDWWFGNTGSVGGMNYLSPILQPSQNVDNPSFHVVFSTFSIFSKLEDVKAFSV
jgi:hypothetical protein